MGHTMLVLGAGGQLGTEVVRAAEAAGWAVAGLTRDDLDLFDTASVRDVLERLEFSACVNSAAYTGVDAAESDAEAAFRVNAYAVEQVAKACATRGARLVQVSTDYVFDGESEGPYLPDDPPAPINVYGASKLAGEALARRAHPDGTLVVRTSSVFGVAGARDGGGNFVETMLRLGRERDRLQVVSDTVMAPTYAPDLAAAIVALLDDDAPADTWHATNEGSASWYQFAVEIVARAGIEAEVQPVTSDRYPATARRPRFSVLHTGRTSDRIGPLPSWRDGLARYLAEREETAGT